MGELLIESEEDRKKKAIANYMNWCITQNLDLKGKGYVWVSEEDRRNG